LLIKQKREVFLEFLKVAAKTEQISLEEEKNV